MRPTRRQFLTTAFASVPLLAASRLSAQEAPTWPPTLRGAKNGTVTLRSERFLETPENVTKLSRVEGAAPFVLAKTPPRVDLAFHGNLGPDAAGRRLWSSWGDICLASDGKVYCAIGDHGD